MSANFENIPQEMHLYNQWVVWRFEDTKGLKPTKVPYSAINGKLASVNDPNTWASFEQAVHAAAGQWYDGIGFVLSESDPYAFIDLDDTKGDKSAMDRQIKVYNEFDSFAEKSPSGNGLHIIVKGQLPCGRRRSYIEIYSSGRYMTMTGDVYRDLPIKDHNELLGVLYSQMSSGSEAAAMYAGVAEEKETDETILERATSAANGDLFAALYDGDWQYKYQSQSEADFALVDILAFYTQNRKQIQRLFRASGLGKREKAQRQDYVNYMLNKCFDRMLPPVDIDGLQNQLAEAMAKNKKEEKAPTSLDSNFKPKILTESSEMKIQPSSDVYRVPPGLVGEIAQFIYAQAPRPVPEIALAGALGMISGIVGRAYNVSGTGLNQYILLLAPTGTGKEAMASGIDKLFASVIRTVPAASEFIGPSEIASSQAIIKYMSKGPNSFTSLVGEFGIYLQGMAAQNAPPHLMGLRRFLLDAYNKSGEGKVFRPSIYADKDKNTNAVVSPAFSILGESTPEMFYEGLHEGLISQGLLPRFTTIEYHGERPPLSHNFGSIQPSFELVEKLSALCAHALMLNSQDKAITVQFDAGAQAMFNDFDRYCDKQINSSDKEIRRHLWNRAHIKAMKLAAPIAIGCNPYDPIITKDIAAWAIDIITADAKNLLDRFNAGEIGVDNDEMKQIVKVTEVVKQFVTSAWPEVSKYAGAKFGQLHANKIIPYAYIQRKLAAVSVFRKDRLGSSTALKRALTTLTERGDLEEVSRATLSKNYGVTCKAYMISNTRAFNI